jgi:hypothetical protein
MTVPHARWGKLLVTLLTGMGIGTSTPCFWLALRASGGTRASLA